MQALVIVSRLVVILGKSSLHFIAPSNAIKISLNRALKTVTEEDTRKFPMINGEGKKVLSCQAISYEISALKTQHIL